MNKNILIIGSGVLGAYLSNFLINKKFNIYVSTRKLKKEYQNYKKLKIQKKINFIKLDIFKKKDIDITLKKIKPTHIYYFAGISSITESFKKPKETMISNYLGAKNFLEIIYKRKINTKFYKANSGYIFDGKGKKINTHSKLIKYNSPYTNSQIKIFKLVNKYSKKNINCCNLIFFNVESPLRPDDFLIKKICKSIKLIKKNEIKNLKVGNIDCVRDFSWAPEIVKAIYFFSKLKPRNIVLGTGKEMSIRYILKTLFKLNKLNYRNFIKIDKKLFRKNEQLKITCSINETILLLKRFNWKPKIFGNKLLIKLYKNS